jgi:membrane-associated phospholipid phosphatase
MNLAWNQSLFVWMNHTATVLPDWLWASLTITGHTSLLFALFAPLLLPRVPNGRVVVTGLFAASLLGGVVSTLAKESFQIPRPPAVLAAEQFHLIGHKLDLVSFPSGHTLAAFAAAALLALGLRLRGWWLVAPFTLACLVGLSRIAVGAHWPLDVLGGAALGLACGWAGWKAAQWLHQWRWAQSVMYASCQSAIIGLVSFSLIATAMGYPEARLWQWTATAVGASFAAYSMFLQLKSLKTYLKG